MAEEFDNDSDDFQDGDQNIPSTMRGRELGLACVNSVSFLKIVWANFTNYYARWKKTISGLSAMSVADSIDYAVTRLILDDYERAVEIMEQSPFKTFETDIIGVELPDQRSTLSGNLHGTTSRGSESAIRIPLALQQRWDAKRLPFMWMILMQASRSLQDRDITLLAEGDLDGDGGILLGLLYPEIQT